MGKLSIIRSFDQSEWHHIGNIYCTKFARWVLFSAENLYYPKILAVSGVVLRSPVERDLMLVPSNAVT